MSFRLVFILLLLSAWACVPKPQSIKGCGSGMEFNNETLGCVTSNPAINLNSTFTTLPVVEDVATSFTLPDATTEASGSLYWFIVTAPSHGDITACADRDTDGTSTGTGTQLRSCIFTPDANYVGTDAFSYKICNTENGASRCGTAIDVAVTITDDGLDLPQISATTSVSVTENSAISFDIRATRVSTGESDPIYLCMDVVDPDGVMNAEAGTKIVAPSGALAFGSTCTLLVNENDSLTPILANFSATANLLACPLDDCEGEAFVILRMCQSANCDVTGINGLDDDADLEIDEEDEWLAADLANVSVRRVAITTTARNFSPVIGGTNPLVLASVAEASATLTIGTAGTNDRVLTTATDLDGDSITYEYVPTSFFPSSAGTFSCTNGTDLACSFTPDADYNGTVNFRYLARDSKTAASSIITVSIQVTAVNDPPIFISGTHIAGYGTTPIALQEDTTLADRTFRVGEGGGGYENTQTVKITATSSNNGVLPPGRIQIKRGSFILGALSGVTPVTLDSTTMDADAQSYTMTFYPVPGVVTSTPVTITLTIDDGTSTATYAFDFTGVTNIDNAPSVALDPAASLGFQVGGSAKDLVLRATPGSNDWANVSGGLQSLTLTVNSSAPTIASASATNLSTAGAGITITKGVGASCTTSSCVYTIAYDGTNNPIDDDLLLSVTPGVRGSSTLTMIVSDGTAANNISKTSVINVFNYVATFNGWKDLKFTGQKRGSVTGLLSEASLTVGWENLTLMEGGSPVTAYSVRVYRKTTNDFTALPANSLEDDGVASTITEATFTTASAFDDGAGWTPGERNYLMLAIIPTALGEVIKPTTAADQVIEIVVPPDNTALIHRWMANKRFCESTGQNPDRAGGTYRCLNLGVGAVPDSGQFYYDQEEHLFVDIYEAGCPYNFAEDVRAVTAVGVTGQVHYERSTGECRYSDGASWILMSSAIPVATVNSHLAELPPMVKISRTQAHAMCGKQAVLCAGAACAAAPFNTAVPELPIRREMVAASIWPTVIPGGFSSSGIEDSGNHTAYKACNTASASGLTFASMPVSLTSDTFPFTATSGFKGLINSAASSDYCESRYGLKNHIGNTAEWLADKFSCTAGTPPFYSCTMSTPIGSSRDDSDPANNAYGLNYAFDNAPGHGIELSQGAGYAVLDGFMNSGVDRFHLALGLPFEYDASVTGVKYGLPEYYVFGTLPLQVDGGLWSYDGIAFLGSTNSANYAAVQGGEWTTGGGAGRFAMGIQEDSDTNAQTGYRCVMRVTPVP